MVPEVQVRLIDDKIIAMLSEVIIVVSQEEII